MNAKILIIDDNEILNELLQDILTDAGYKIFTAINGEEGKAKLREVKPDLVILDLQLPDTSGLQILEEINEGLDVIQVIVLTGFGTVESAISAMKLGASDYLMKPISNEKLLISVEKNLKHLMLLRDIENLREVDRRQYKFNYIISNSDKMKEIYSLALSAAESDSSTVLIEGESGTGKEYLARFIHFRSKRRDGPFVEINCAAIPENLMESELFGYEPGAFTDARTTKKGQIELSRGGTVFLDEIGELTPILQAKLLRFLDTMTFKRVGGNTDITMDVRVIAATNKNLIDAMERGEFRDDLFFRLKVLYLNIPPLRERRGEVEVFATALLNEYSKSLKKKVKGFSESAMKRLMEYSWPGNIRELKNVIERAIIVADKEKIYPRHLALPSTSRDEGSSRFSQVTTNGNINFQEVLDGVAREMLVEALKQANGNKSKAARFLNMHRHVFLYQLEKLNVAV
jgi:two-component system, NtrC family, response regulator AtoC